MKLAAVLAHEISHVLANHTREQRSAFTLGQVILAPFTLVFVVAETLGLVKTHSIANPVWLSHLVLMYLRRRQEEEADYISTLLMVNAGFDPSATVSIYKKIKNFQDQDPRIQQVPQWMDTHPDVS